MADPRITIKVEGFSGSWNDLKDRPFGESQGLITVLPETTLSFAHDAYWDPDGVETGFNDGNIGAEYLVTCNGVDSLCVVTDLGRMGPGFYVSDGNSDKALMVASGCRYIYAQYKGEYTISIRKKGIVIQTLEPKFLPEVTVTWDIDNMDSTGMPAPSCSVSYDEFVSAVQSGVHVRGKAITGGAVAMVGDAVAINGQIAEGVEGWLIELKHSNLHLGAHYKPDGTIMHYSG